MAKSTRTYSVNWDDVTGFISSPGKKMVRITKVETGVSGAGKRKEVLTLTSREGTAKVHLSMSTKAMWKVKQYLIAAQIPLKANFNPEDFLTGKPFWAEFTATVSDDDKVYYNADKVYAATKAEIEEYESEGSDVEDTEDDSEAPWNGDSEDTEFDIDEASDEEVIEKAKELGIYSSGLKPKALRAKVKAELD